MLKCWRCNSSILEVGGNLNWTCKGCGRAGVLRGAFNRWQGWWRNTPYTPAVLRGDWGRVFVNKQNQVYRFHKYTFRHRMRLLIGITGKFKGSEYLFRWVKFRGCLHYFLNWLLMSKRLRCSRSLRQSGKLGRKIIMQPCPSPSKP